MLTASLVIVTGISGSSGAADAQGPLTSGNPSRVAPERCPDYRRGLVFYRSRYAEHRTKMGAEHSVAQVPKQSCARVRYLASRWRAKAYAARRAVERYYERMRNDPVLAIRHVFGVYAEQAIRVAKCESGWSMTPRAHNGQYLGTFQMGSSERRLYGHGDTVLEQARAAYRYFVASGRDWSPWSCRP